MSRFKELPPSCMKIIVYFILIPSTYFLFYEKNPNVTVSITKILIIIFIIIKIILFILKQIKNHFKSIRQKKIEAYSKKNRLKLIPYFPKPLKIGNNMFCFNNKNDLVYMNVIEIPDKSKGEIYIGELEWTSTSSSSSSKNIGNDVRSDRTKNYITMCVLFDDNFNLPHFELCPETIFVKTSELLGLNNTEDIDFSSDKEFSDNWWLCSSENMFIKDLFTQNIRTNFMNLIDRNYTIGGKHNMLIIITDNPIEPEKYNAVIKDIKTIRLFMKNNKKYYKEPKKETKEPSENEN